MNEWKELKTLQEIAAAQAAGEEIELYSPYSSEWIHWEGRGWHHQCQYRSRPKKKTKTIVLREALMRLKDCYWILWTNDDSDHSFVKWLDTPERIIEVEE